MQRKGELKITYKLDHRYTKEVDYVPCFLCESETAILDISENDYIMTCDQCGATELKTVENMDNEKGRMC